MYPLLLVCLFISVVLIPTGLAFLLFFQRGLWEQNKKIFAAAIASWYLLYAVFFLFLTGPKDLSKYPSAQNSPYLLPWDAGVERFVAQGNRSFTSHRGKHFYAWDFVMANGTEVLAAREGIVHKVEDQHEGIGYFSNYIVIEHDDGTQAGYAHIQKDSAAVELGDPVKQGQAIALSGMVGQTLFPHLHFYVLNSQGTMSLPISFRDVEGGVPVAGRFYRSKNEKVQSSKSEMDRK